jgi:hypothetical protein|tara:strand:- start:377 stop:964 length:588 start_codon:yes stop_codon:yes gene_type:complete
MPKKCPPGVFCIENITMAFLFILILITGFLIYQYIKNPIHITNQLPSPTVITNNQPSQDNIFNNALEPPLRTNQYFPPLAGDVRGGIPINIKTRPTQHSFQQVGILTKPGSDENLILPLMGRISDSGRDKWEFYTISNTGSVNTKLPVSIRGKNCSSEYGCEDIMNSDSVYVEGYNDTFKVTKYGNSNFRYIPVL